MAAGCDLPSQLSNPSTLNVAEHQRPAAMLCALARKYACRTRPTISWTNGRQGTVLVTHGKTTAARRLLPLTPRVRSELETRWQRAGKPGDGWVQPAFTKSGHIEPSSLKKLHASVFETLAAEAEKGNGKPVRNFVLYSLRRTLLTRLGELVATLGLWHGSLDTVRLGFQHDTFTHRRMPAMARLGRHKIGHSAGTPQLPTPHQEQVTH